MGRPPRKLCLFYDAVPTSILCDLRGEGLLDVTKDAPFHHPISPLDEQLPTYAVFLQSGAQFLQVMYPSLGGPARIM